MPNAALIISQSVSKKAAVLNLNLGDASESPGRNLLKCLFPGCSPVLMLEGWDEAQKPVCSKNTSADSDAGYLSTL